MDTRLLQTFEKSNEFSDSPFEYRLKTRFFANNTLDMVMTKIKHRVEKTKDAVGGFYGVTYPKTLNNDELEAKRLENLERAVRRARQAVHFACRQIGADHMLTLTTRENIGCKTEFFEVFTRFIRLVREKDLVKEFGQNKLAKTMPPRLLTRSLKREWLYVAVPELQERGAYHMHIACVGKQDLDLLRACWYVALGGKITDTGKAVKGQVDVQCHKKRFSGYTDTHKTFSLVRYLTKYISKGFEQSSELGQHRYKLSRSIPKPKEHKQHIVACFSGGSNGFIDAMFEVLQIADFIGVDKNFELWNRGQDVFILRGCYS